MHAYSRGAGTKEQALWACEKSMEYAEKKIEVLYQYKAEAENKTTELKAAAIKRLDEEIESVKNVVDSYYEWYIRVRGSNGFTRRFP
jgi:hypothetical protein